MKTFFENIFKTKISVKKLLLALVFILIIAGVSIYNAGFYVVVRFNELGPLIKNMSAYYNGFKIGKIVNLQPDKDFKHILVKVDLNQKNMKLPQNMIVYVERFPNGELYLQFVYPNSPSLNTLRRGDILEGIATSSVEQFMMGQSISGMSDLVSLHIIKALNSADAANREMKVFFQVTSALIKENGKGIDEAVNNAAKMTKSLAQMAENLNQTSRKLNSALDEKSLKDTTSNIKDATTNVVVVTDNISKATTDIDKTMKKLDDTISQANATAQNLNSITSGLNETLSRRFAGMRIMFGTPIKPKS